MINVRTHRPTISTKSNKMPEVEKDVVSLQLLGGRTLRFESRQLRINLKCRAAVSCALNGILKLIDCNVLILLKKARVFIEAVQLLALLVVLSRLTSDEFVLYFKLNANHPIR